MPYSKFKLEEVIEKFDLKLKKEEIFKPKKFNISNSLKEILKLSKRMPIRSEKSRNEFIVVPILMELKRHNMDNFSFFSGENLDIDNSLGLNGECDFILTTKESYIIEAPILGLVEAKKQDIDLGLGQCVAQMIGVKLFNEQKKNILNRIYGCVTSGEDWQFLALEGNNLIFDENRYYINELENILSIFQQIIDECGEK